MKSTLKVQASCHIGISHWNLVPLIAVLFAGPCPATLISAIFSPALFKCLQTGHSTRLSLTASLGTLTQAWEAIAMSAWRRSSSKKIQKIYVKPGSRFSSILVRYFKNAEHVLEGSGCPSQTQGWHNFVGNWESEPVLGSHKCSFMEWQGYFSNKYFILGEVRGSILFVLIINTFYFW